MRRRLPPSLLAGGVLVALVVLVAVVATIWTPRNPTQVDVTQRLSGIGQNGFPLGSDQLGRDELSLLMAGARTTLLVGVVTVVIAVAVGVPLGGLAALFGGALEEAVMRVSDVLLAFPALLLAILFAAVFRPGTLTAMAAIGIAFVPSFARVVRGAGLQVMVQDYVMVARGWGSGPLWLLVRHLIPNVGSVIIVQATVAFAIAILAEASLSYLGLGTTPGTPSWGLMLAEAQTYLGQAPLLGVWPGLCIGLSVLGFSLLGDGLRDLLDPRLVERMAHS
jgi:peptide/nickel transport system permease protein